MSWSRCWRRKARKIVPIQNPCNSLTIPQGTARLTVHVGAAFLAAATKLCELLEGAEDCFRSDKRESISAGAKRVWLVRRLHLAIYRRQSSGQLLAVGETSSRQHAAIRRHEQGPKEAGILFRGYNDLLRVHAGGRHGERSPRHLLPLPVTGLSA
jgi:hypothetical protein